MPAVRMHVDHMDMVMDMDMDMVMGIWTWTWTWTRAVRRGTWLSDVCFAANEECGPAPAAVRRKGKGARAEV